MQLQALLKFSSLSLLLTLVISFGSCAANSTSEPQVKQSSSGICHDNSSGSFKRTKNYVPFDTIATCIEAGGRLPKGKTHQVDKATNEAIEQGGEFSSLYDRSDWPHWSDDDRDCQNTRHELLLTDSSVSVTFKSDKQCNILVGSWYDPYSNKTYTISKDLDLDHIVPLKFAHGHGADKWSRERKKQFANDNGNLLLVNASLNRQKGAKGLDEWLPPNQSYRCEYIARFNSVMTQYELSYIPSEKRIISRMVKACVK
jgi:hypothetical protein